MQIQSKVVLPLEQIPEKNRSADEQSKSRSSRHAKNLNPVENERKISFVGKYCMEYLDSFILLIGDYNF